MTRHLIRETNIPLNWFWWVIDSDCHVVPFHIIVVTVYDEFFLLLPMKKEKKKIKIAVVNAISFNFHVPRP